MIVHPEDVEANAVLQNVVFSLKLTLKNKGYWYAHYNNFYFCTLEPCDWCRIHFQQIFLAKKPIIVGMFLRNDDLDDLDKCLLLQANIRIDNLYELAMFHPIENCFFAQAVLYDEIMKKNNPINKIIFTRRLCTEFIAKEIVREYIKSRADEEAYCAVTQRGMYHIRYWFMDDTTEEEIERFIDYFFILRRQYHNRNPNNDRVVTIRSSLSSHESIHIMPVHISEDTNTIYIRFPEYPVTTNTVGFTCYHTSLRLSHCMKLLQQLCRNISVKVDINVKRNNACSCANNSVHIPFYPTFKTHYEQGAVVECWN